MKKHHVFIPYMNNEEKLKKNRNKKDEEINRHHILPKSRGGTNAEDNIKKLFTSYHDSLHRVFGNLTFQEQVNRIIELSKTAITEDVKRDLQKILMEDDIEYFYKKDVVDKRYW